MNGKKARDKPLDILNAVRAWAADLLLIVGVVMVAVGAGMIYAPAGWIARGDPGGDGG